VNPAGAGVRLRAERKRPERAVISAFNTHEIIRSCADQAGLPELDRVLDSIRLDW
jgi:hypothetical protein